MSFEEKSILFKSLGDPIRLKIVSRLCEGPLSANELLSGMDIAQPTLSHHIKILKQAGIIEESKDKNRRIYNIDCDVLGEIVSSLNNFIEICSNK